jgi:hypothetical protein
MPSLTSLEKAAESFGFDASWKGAELRVRVPGVAGFRIIAPQGKPAARTWFGLMPEWALRLEIVVFGLVAGLLLGYARPPVPWHLIGLIAVLSIGLGVTLWRAQRAKERLFTRATELETGIGGLRT